MKKEAVSKQEIAPRSQKVQNNGRGCSKIALKNKKPRLPKRVALASRLW